MARRFSAILFVFLPVLLVTSVAWSLFMEDLGEREKALQEAESAGPADSAVLPDPAGAGGETPLEREHVAASAAAAGSRKDSVPASLLIRVVDESTGAPLPGAQVWLFANRRRETVQADEAGTALFVNLDSGTYRVGAACDGFANGLAIVEIPESKAPAEASLALERGAAVEGRVVCASTGAGLAGARVAYFDPGSGSSRLCITGPGGAFRLAGLPDFRPPKAGDFRFGLSGYFRRENGPEPAFVDKGGGAYAAELVLEPGLPVAGRVVHAAGGPAARAKVFALDLLFAADGVRAARQDFGRLVSGGGFETYESCTATAGEDGFFAIPAVPAGIDVCIAAEVPGCSLAIGPPLVLVPGMPPPAVMLQAHPEARVHATVVQKAHGSGPAAGASVDLYVFPPGDPLALLRPRAAAERFVSQGMSDENGTCSFFGLGPGTYELRASKQGDGEARSGRFSVDAGGEFAATLTLPGAPLAVAGTVTDSKGKPVQGIVVELTPVPIPEGQAVVPPSGRTDAAGRFRVAGLREGRQHMLRARDPGGRYVVPRPGNSAGPVIPGAEDLHLIAFRCGRASGRVQGLPAGTSPKIVFVSETEAGGREEAAASVAAGFFEVKKLLPGRCRVMLKGEGITEKCLGMLDVAEGAELEGLVFDYGPAACLEGKVLDRRSGGPVCGAAVSLIDPGVAQASPENEFGAGVVMEAVTAADGAFRFEGIDPRAYDIVAWASGSGECRLAGVTAGAEETRSGCTLVLEPGVRVLATFLGGSDQAPARNAPVWIVDADRFDRKVATGGDGRLAVNLLPGEYIFVLGGSLLLSGAARVSVPETAELEITLRF